MARDKHAPSARRTIGLLGGSFNPAHAGHVHISQEALRRLGLDQVWWLVSPQNPLKPVKGMMAFTERFARAQKMAAGVKRIVVSDIETQLGTRYTYDTVQALQARFPQAHFVWLMGADNLVQLHRWQKWQALMRLVPVAVFDRAPFSHRALRSKAALAFWRRKVAPGALLRRSVPVWAYIAMRLHPASATAIRARIGRD